MSGGGFLCVPYEVLQWESWEQKNAFIDLQRRAVWAVQERRTQGVTVTLHRGELLFSVREACVWWGGWSEKAVRTLMDRLASEGLIEYPEGTAHRRMYRVRLTPFWNETPGDAGASGGARKGASMGASIQLPGLHLGDIEAQAGAQGKAQAGAQGKEDKKEDKSLVPTERENAGARVREGGQQVVQAFDAALKTAGRPGVPSEDWPAQVRMAQTAVRKGMPPGEAEQAIAWGMADQWQRQRLRAHGMKVIRDVWAAWQERRGNGRGPPHNGRTNGRAYVDPATAPVQFTPGGPWDTQDEIE